MCWLAKLSYITISKPKRKALGWTKGGFSKVVLWFWTLHMNSEGLWSAPTKFRGWVNPSSVCKWGARIPISVSGNVITLIILAGGCRYSPLDIRAKSWCFNELRWTNTQFLPIQSPAPCLAEFSHIMIPDKPHTNRRKHLSSKLHSRHFGLVQFKHKRRNFLRTSWTKGWRKLI